jgi:hypothetical protein
MANTLIQLKYSTATDKPAKLNIAEPAYSYTSNTLFIGTPDSLGTINIGGLFYTSQIDNATNLATGNTIVKRDATGNAIFNVLTANTINATIEGNSNTATQLQTARFFNFTGDVDAVAVSFDGTANADFTLELTNTGVSSGTYGGSTNIPVITVDEDGRITSASNTSISTDLNIVADTGSNTISLATDSLTFVGADGITTSIGPTDNVSFAVDNTVIRTTGNQTITGDFTLNGNLNVQGNTITYGVESYTVNDPIILIANNNTGNIVDIGFVGHYVEDEETKHTGLIRNVATNTWYLFENYGPHIQEDHVLNIANPTLVTSNLVTNIIGGRVYDLASSIEVADGGTGRNTFTTGSIVIGNGTNGLLELANTSSAGTYGNAAFVPIVTVDNYGRVSSVSVEEIKISMDDLDGILPVINGGLGANTFTSGEQIVYNGTNFVSLANVSTTITGTLSTSNTITSVTTDGYGRLTALTSNPITIDANQVTSGTLLVDRGGSGASSFTLNGVLLGNSNSAFQTASSSTEGHLLTINASGVPTFSMLSGGTF